MYGLVLRATIPPFLVASAAASFASPARAEAQTGGSPTLTLGAATQQVGKGAGQTRGEPTVFAALRTGRGPLYASASANTVRLGPGGEGEANLTVGARSKAAGFEGHAGVHLMQRLGAAEGFDGRWVEYEVGVTRALGRASAALIVNYSPDADGPAREAWWNQALVAWGLTDASRISAAVGRRTADGGGDYNAWNIGFTHRTPAGAAFDVRFHDTDKHEFGGEFGRRLVGTLSHTF